MTSQGSPAPTPEWRVVDGRLITSLSAPDAAGAGRFAAGAWALLQEQGPDAPARSVLTLSGTRIDLGLAPATGNEPGEPEQGLARHLEALAAEHGIEPELSRRHEVSVWVPTAPDAVYALVSDVTRTGRWSPTCRACRWTDPGQRGVGATFEGDNQTPKRRWTTLSTVIEADPGRRFAWAVNGGLVEWGFSLAPATEGGTLLTQTWHFTREGRAFFDEKWGPDALAQADQRERQAHADMPVTLARIATTLQEHR